uniref:non-specific serine/threonine protein kinase n=1 Tax=Arabidopsis thaliana TaxID=3702 RepID=O80865_ARATH|nr:putative protein kinase [Arabidopsis thaliana]
MSLPSSPHAYRCQTFGRRGPSEFAVKDTWNKVVESSTLQNQPLLPYQEWDIDFSELTVGTRVGIGFFGEVFRGVWNGTDVAIKLFLEQDLTAENMEDFCNEISILSRVRHPNVVLFLGACTKPPRLSMITEYMELGSLYYLIHMSGQKKKLSWHRRLRMLRDICRGLMCIHRMKIVHRDLKSANCLVDKHWTVKICDFGLSRIMTDENMKDTSSAGTPEWMAPELIRNRPFTEKCDIFSLGVIMWELSTLRKPWEGVPPEKVVFAVAHEGSRLEIPDGPLSKLIAGLVLLNTMFLELFCLFSYISQLLQSELKLTTISVQIVGQSLKNAQIVKRYLEAYSIVSTHCANNTSLSGGYEPEDVLAQKTSQLLLNLGS